MSAIEETKSGLGVQPARARADKPSVVTRVLNFLSSVRFGVSLLMLLSVACMIGMLVMQQNIDGFDKYYLDLSPATRLLFGTLGFFDIYHVWYFNALLLVLSLNIVLASIDRFPGAWKYISRPKVEAGPQWLRTQDQTAAVEMRSANTREAAEKVANTFRAVGLKPTITEKNGRTTVFGERGTWNRLGAYSVHVALLTIFFGGFLTSQFGFTGNLPLEPGGSGNKIMERVLDENGEPKLVTMPLPFTVECTDIQQKLIREDGPITADNTLDWLTAVRIKDPTYGVKEGVTHMNAPLDFKRGWWWDNYRFFQASFTPNGKARTVTLRVAPEAGGEARELTIPRDGSTTLPDGTRIELKDFDARFSAGQQQQLEEKTDYQNPVAILQIHPPGGGASERAFAFTPQMAENAPFAKRPVKGYTYRLVSFEKVPEQHVLSVQRDPGATVVYVGFGMLGLTLSGVFFFSHQRVWAAVVEKGEGSFDVMLGGNTNRNKLGFEDRFKRLVAALGGHKVEVKQ